MKYYPFDSRNKLYRSHIGAVPEESPLRLRILLHNDINVISAFLLISDDEFGDTSEILLTEGENLDGYRSFECEIELFEGLYWYCFKYKTDLGEFYITKKGSTSQGKVSQRGGWWQQTVYSGDFKTPEWLEGGIIYQIFPDRFYNSKAPKSNVPSDRYIVKSWQKQPEYRQNCGKCSLSNDYYCGDLKGITQKLDYLKSLGVTVIYLNPIFEAHSNHRYNVADYFKIDPLLGNDSDFKYLCESAHKKGIRIILDGVFSHTGDDSRYFNKKGRYDTPGAVNSPDSPYRYWYNFENYPDKYKAWWGIEELPEIIENNPDFTEFITGNEGVLRHWIKSGADGWRLDVADELPDEFLDKTRLAVKSENPEAYILGEVWEDASNKISYNKRRRFLRGRQLDSVMNYPLSEAITDFVRNGNATGLVNTVLSITENYPKPSINCLMNLLGTHDTMRILTKLVTEKYLESRSEQSKAHLSGEMYQKGLKLLRLAAAIQYTLPGIPSVYYGDETGLEGYGDPFCRATFDWNKADCEINRFYKKLGNIRHSAEALKKGEFLPLAARKGFICYERICGDFGTLTAVNAGLRKVNFTLPDDYKGAKTNFDGTINNSILTLPPYSCEILIKA